MKNNWLKICVLALALPLLLCSSCSFASHGGTTSNGGSTNAGDDNGGEKFSMLAEIENLDTPFQVDVIRAEYASGPYWIVTSPQTEYEDKNGNRITKSDLCVGDTVEIYYNGQVMMSFPPQVVAHKIVKQ